MDRTEIRKHYATHFLKLSLWYVHRLIHTEGIAFEDAVNNRVNIYRNTDFFDGRNHPARGHDDFAWNAFLVGLTEIYAAHDGNTDALEEAGLAYLYPRVRWGGGGPPDLGKRPYECWTFDDGGDHIAIHIANVYQPESPLTTKRVAFAASLLRLLEDTRARRPEVETVRCGSWLNSMPPFQTLFPRHWHDSACVSPRSSFGMGHWGQFADRTGRFHVRNGQRFRNTGAFPYASLGCNAPLDEIVAHLRWHFPEAVEYNQWAVGSRQ